MDKIKGITWKAYNKAIENDIEKEQIEVNLKQIGINKIFIFNTLKGDKGLSRQLRVFKFREPLNWETYYHYVKRSDKVMDIGANIGLFSILSKKAKSLICIEPIECCIPLLEKNIKDNDIKATIINKAIGKNIKMKIDEQINLSHVSNDGIPIESLTLKEACKLYDSNLLRMDVEGYEYDIFKEGIPNTINKICLEFHTTILGKKKTLELLSIFEKNGFNIDYMLEDLPLRLYPYYKFLKYTKLIKLITYKKKNISFNRAKDLIFKGRNLKYFLISRNKYGFDSRSVV